MENLALGLKGTRPGGASGAGREAVPRLRSPSAERLSQKGGGAASAVEAGSSDG